VVIFRTTAAAPQILHRLANHLLSTVVVRVGAHRHVDSGRKRSGVVIAVWIAMAPRRGPQI